MSRIGIAVLALVLAGLTVAACGAVGLSPSVAA